MFIFLFLVLLLGSPAAGQNSRESGPSVIVYSNGGAFLVTAPSGWVADKETGQQLGLCCVFYPAGQTWNDAESIMYPEIVEKNAQHRTLQDFMAFDLEQFRMGNPNLTFEDSEPLHFGSKTALIRYFQGVNKGSSEAVAYIDEPKTIAVLVLSSKTSVALNKSLPLFRDFVQSYAFMKVRFTESPAATDSDNHTPPNH